MTWDETILHVMGKQPCRRWLVQEICAEVEKNPIVTAHHRELWGSQPNFHHWVRSALARLKKAGDIKHVARSTYTLAS